MWLYNVICSLLVYAVRAFYYDAQSLKICFSYSCVFMLCRKVTLLPVKNQGTALFFYSFNLNRLFRLFFVGIVGYVRTYHRQGGSLKTIGQLKVSISLSRAAWYVATKLMCRLICNCRASESRSKLYLVMPSAAYNQ